MKSLFNFQLNSVAKDIYPLVIKFLEFSLVKGIADSFHKGVVEIEVVNNAKTHTEHFSCLEKMADVGSGIGSAYGTVTIGIERELILKEFLV